MGFEKKERKKDKRKIRMRRMGLIPSFSATKVGIARLWSLDFLISLKLDFS
jgi:hypothetical protein